MRGFRALESVFRQSVKLNKSRTFSTEARTAVDDYRQQPRAAILQEADAFNVEELVNLTEMFKKRMHLGHKKSMLNPFMQPFVYGSRFDHLIIDLEKSREHLIKALNFVAHIAYSDGIILFISRNHDTAHTVEECAKECKEFAHVRSWDQGLFTNSITTFGREIRLPDCGIFLTTRGSQFAVNEFAKIMIPTVGIVDTDSDPRLICYPVPGNDDTAETIEYYCGMFKQAILKGKMRRKNDIAKMDSNLEKSLAA